MDNRPKSISQSSFTLSVIQKVHDPQLQKAWSELSEKKKNELADENFMTLKGLDKAIKEGTINKSLAEEIKKSLGIGGEVPLEIGRTKAPVLNDATPTWVIDEIPEDLVSVGSISLEWQPIGTHGANVTIKYTPEQNLLPEGTRIGFIQSVKSDLLQDDGKERADMHPKSMAIDRQSEIRSESPFFGVTNWVLDQPGKLEPSKIILGTDKTPATMTDTPVCGGKQLEWKPQFETNAVVISCPNTMFEGVILSTVVWNMDVRPQQSVKDKKRIPKLTYELRNAPTKEFLIAAKIWNEIVYQQDNNPKKGKRELIKLKGIRS